MRAIYRYMAYEIDILGEVGTWGYPSNYLRYQLKDAAGKPVTINISSPGGEVTEGLAMFDMLQAYEGEVSTLGYGLVASIASVILLAGKRVKMTKNSFLMIHNPWTMAVGDASEMTATAEVLAKMQENLLNIYVDRIQQSGKAAGNVSLKVKRMMDTETWLTAQEALDLGLIDEIQESNKEANIIQMQPALARYVNVPAALLLNQKNDNMSAKEVLDKVKAMLGGVEEPVQEAIPSTEPEPAPAPTMTPEQAKKLLVESGYKVLTDDELAALAEQAQKATEAEKTAEQMAETMQTLAAEMVAIKAQLKASAGTPSGASGAVAPQREEQATSAFNALAAIWNNKRKLQ